VDLDALGPVQGLERSSAVMVHKVLGIGPRRSPVVRRGERALSRFVGRQREMATLQALLGQAEDGRGQVVGLVGEPGIGKSRLMYEFRAGLADNRAWGRIMRGWAAAEAGIRETGVAEMRQGLAALRATGVGLRQPYYLGLLAEACGKADGVEGGLILLAEALKVVDNTGECWWEAELHRLKGELLLRQAPGDIGRSPLQCEAETCFRRALTIAHRQQAQPIALRAATSLSRVWQQRGEIEAARQLLAPMYGWFTEGLDTADLQQARALLEQLA
jgi:AAA ATPase domain